MTQTPNSIHEDCGYPEAAHAEFDINGKCVIDLPDEGVATPGCLCCGLLAVRGAELPCGDCR